MKVLCDPRMPLNWRPAPATVYFNPIQGSRTEHDLHVPEPGPAPLSWLEDLDEAVLNIPAFLRRPLIRERPAMSGEGIL